MIPWFSRVMALFFLCTLFVTGQVGAEPARGTEILLNSTEGKAVRLADFQGKVVVVNFWATWCPPCLHEIPEFIRFQTAYADKGVVVVGINFMDNINQKELDEFKKNNKINYTLLYGTPSKVGQLANDLGGVLGLPVSKLLDKKGQVLSSHIGGLTERDLQNLVKPLLAP